LKIVVFGAGAIGSLFGGYLAKENDVTLVCRKQHAEAINRNGLSITGLTDLLVRPGAVTSVEGSEPPEILILAVKAYDTAASLEDIKKLMSPGTVLVSLQNGLGNLELLREAFPGGDIVGGITSQGAILRAPGVVEHTGRSYTVVGGTGNAPRIAALLNGCGLGTTVSADIARDIWYKALVNSAINPIATLLGERNGIIHEREDLAPLVGAIVAEGAEVAESGGIALSKSDALTKVMQVARETAGNSNSMLLDIRNGRKTEIMQMNGAIARYGAVAGIRTPANSLMAALIRALESRGIS